MAICISGCTSQPPRNKINQKVDLCFTEIDSQSYLASHLSHPLNTKLATSEAGAMSVIISAAIEGRFGKYIDAKEVYKVLTRESSLATRPNLLHAKKTVEDFGYGVKAYRGNRYNLQKFKKVMAISLDGGYRIHLIYGVENDIVHTVYPDGSVCQMDYPTFQMETKNFPIMFLTNSS